MHVYGGKMESTVWIAIFRFPPAVLHSYTGENQYSWKIVNQLNWDIDRV